MCICRIIFLTGASNNHNEGGGGAGTMVPLTTLLAGRPLEPTNIEQCRERKRIEEACRTEMDCGGLKRIAGYRGLLFTNSLQ